MEVRVKLHVNHDLNVQNIWMSLNYDKKPTINHIIDHLANNLCLDTDAIKLYLDDYWLPPWENSRLLRENDCIKVLITENIKKVKDVNNEIANKQIKSTNQENNYTNKYLNNEQITSKSNNLNINLNQLNDNDKKNAKTNEKIQLKTTTTTATTAASTSAKPTNSTSSANNLNKINSKFAVANFVHLLQNSNNEKNSKNENDEEYYEEEYEDEKGYDDDEYYDENREEDYFEKDNKKLRNNEANGSGQVYYTKTNIDRIAQSINSTAKSKWKNSNNQTSQTTKPTHIIFESDSSDSSSDSSSTTDSSSSSSSSNNNKKITQKKTQNKQNNQAKQQQQQQQQQQQKQNQNQNNKKANNNNNNNKNNENKTTTANNTNNNNKKKSPAKQKQQQQQKPNNYYKTKDEQINSNTGSLKEFKKIFNDTKYKSPACGEEPQAVESIFKEQIVVDYEKYEAFTGTPKPTDKIAFQVLEISDSFTPEISGYKTAEVISFNAETNEIELKLEGRYNEVLSKPNKFTIVEEEVEGEEDDEEEDGENTKEKVRKQSSIDEPEDNILKIDWNSLLNVKSIPTTPETTTTEAQTPSTSVENTDTQTNTTTEQTVN